MKKTEKLVALLVTFAFLSALVCVVKAQAPAEEMRTFFDSEIPGIKIQVNATAETQPNGNITVIVSMKRVTDVDVKHFNFSIFGFLNGTYKTLMTNITDDNFPLEDTPRKYNCTFRVPEQVWAVTYGEITLTYDARYTTGQGITTIIPYEDLIFGFPMTHVENVYLEALENLCSAYMQLNQTFWDCFQMNLTEENLALLNKTYREFQGSQSELGNTRTMVAVLAVTTVFFVATTLYLVMRKPKQYW